MMRMLRASVVLVAIVLLCPWSASAQSRPKVDSIALINGDRITCEVTLLSRGQLTVKTDDAGTVVVKWDKIVSIVTLDEFDIGLDDGRHLVGRLEATANGSLAVVDLTGGVTDTVPLSHVVSLARLRARFWEQLEGSVDLGASYTQSSGVAQTYFDGTATYRQPAFAATVLGSFSVTSKPDEEDSSRSLVQFGYMRYRANRWVVTPFGLVESNRDLGFDLRSTGAFTYGRFLVQSNGGQLLLSGGLSVGREQPIDTDAVTNVDAVMAFSGSVFNYDFPKTNIDVNVLVFAALKNAGRYRINTNAKFRREIVRNLNFSISAYDYYDTRPLSTAADTNDVGYSLSIGWTF